MSPLPVPKARRSSSSADKNDKIDMILALLGRNTEAMNDNFERIHKHMETRDAEINKRFDDVDSKLHKVKQDAAAANAGVNARFQTLEDRAASLEEGRAAGNSAADDPPPRQRSTVVIGGWDQDTDRGVILDELSAWLSANDVHPVARWVPGPRHFLAKIRFSSPREAWEFLDSRPNFLGKWIAVERTLAESSQRKPSMEAYKLIKEHLSQDLHNKLQMDAGRGIIWLQGRRILDKSGASFTWTSHPHIADALEAMQSELPCRLASTRM